MHSRVASLILVLCLLLSVGVALPFSSSKNTVHAHPPPQPHHVRSQPAGQCAVSPTNFTWPDFEFVNQGAGTIPPTCTLTARVFTRSVFPPVAIDSEDNTYVSDTRGFIRISPVGVPSYALPPGLFTCQAAGVFGCYVMVPNVSLGTCVVSAYAWPDAKQSWSANFPLSVLSCYPDSTTTQLFVASLSTLIVFNYTSFTALNAYTGATLFRGSVPTPPSSFESNYLASNGDVLFVSSGTSVYAFSITANPGQEMWSTPIFNAQFNIFFQASSSLLFVQNILTFTPTTSLGLVALDVATGVLEWGEGASPCTAIVSVLPNCSAICFDNSTSPKAFLYPLTSTLPPASPSPSDYLPYSYIVDAVSDSTSHLALALQAPGTNTTTIVAHDLATNTQLWNTTIPFSIVYLAISDSAVVVNAFVPDENGYVYVFGTTGDPCPPFIPG